LNGVTLLLKRPQHIIAMVGELRFDHRQRTSGGNDAPWSQPGFQFEPTLFGGDFGCRNDSVSLRVAGEAPAPNGLIIGMAATHLAKRSQGIFESHFQFLSNKNGRRSGRAEL
jgi:hypothetical protein